MTEAPASYIIFDRSESPLHRKEIYNFFLSHHIQDFNEAHILGYSMLPKQKSCMPCNQDMCSLCRENSLLKIRK